METHQTTDLRIAGSIPAMLVFLDDKKHINDKSIYQNWRKGTQVVNKSRVSYISYICYISYILSKKKNKKVDYLTFPSV